MKVLRLTIVLVIMAILGSLLAFSQGWVASAEAIAWRANPEKLSISYNSSLLTSSSTFTMYLPVTLKRWPSNPKKGVGVIAPPGCTDADLLKAGWYFNWQATPPAGCSGQGDGFVPRISNAGGMASLSTAIANAKSSGWLIGFNEPNLPWQSNISPADGAVLWKQIEDAAIPAGIKLVSPAPNQSNPGQDDPHGHQWLWAMVSEYQTRYGKKPHFDAIGWNLYGCINNPACLDVNEMKDYLMQRRQEALNRGYDLPIWLLEVGGCLTANSSASDQTVMTEMGQWFNQTEWIGRYAWFSNRIANSFQGNHNCFLLNSNGNLSTLGQIYQGL